MDNGWSMGASPSATRQPQGRWKLATAVAILILVAGIGGYYIYQGSKPPSSPKLTVISASAQTSSGTTSCRIGDQQVQPIEISCGVYINAGDSGTLTISISNPSSQVTTVAFSTSTSEGPYVTFTSVPDCHQGFGGFCSIGPGLSMTFPFTFTATQTHTSSVQTSLWVYVASLSS